MDDPTVTRYQRRADDLQEDRYRRLQSKVDEVDAKVDALHIRMAYWSGGLALLVILVNIIGPVIVERLMHP